MPRPPRAPPRTPSARARAARRRRQRAPGTRAHSRPAAGRRRRWPQCRPPPRAGNHGGRAGGVQDGGRVRSCRDLASRYREVRSGTTRAPRILVSPPRQPYLARLELTWVWGDFRPSQSRAAVGPGARRQPRGLLRAIRFHYRPVRYLWTRFAASRRPALALGPLGCVSFDDIEPPPLPGPDWVRIETAVSGICGSDLAAVTAHDSFTLEPFGAFPFTFGHENVGRIVETGAAAEPWHTGDRVIVNPMLACAQRGLEPACPACARGEYGLCRRTREGTVGTGPMIGYCPRVGGGWSAFFVAHRTQLHTADDLSDDVAVLTDPL